MLLQLMRGAGPPGLAAMPAQRSPERRVRRCSGRFSCCHAAVIERIRASPRPRVGGRRVERRLERQTQLHPARHRAAPCAGVSRLSRHARACRRSPGGGGTARGRPCAARRWHARDAGRTTPA
jgi:hypothetical protein